MARTWKATHSKVLRLKYSRYSSFHVLFYVLTARGWNLTVGLTSAAGFFILCLARQMLLVLVLVDMAVLDQSIPQQRFPAISLLRPKA